MYVCGLGRVSTESTFYTAPVPRSAPYPVCHFTLPKPFSNYLLANALLNGLPLLRVAMVLTTGNAISLTAMIAGRSCPGSALRQPAQVQLDVHAVCGQYGQRTKHGRNATLRCPSPTLHHQGRPYGASFTAGQPTHAHTHLDTCTLTYASAHPMSTNKRALVDCLPSVGDNCSGHSVVMMPSFDPPPLFLPSFLRPPQHTQYTRAMRPFLHVI